MDDIYPTKDMTGKPLGKVMLEALKDVVSSNGGGVSIHDYPRSVWQGLINRGLAQGKAGTYSTIVHTKGGLQFIRGLKAREATHSANQEE